MVLDKYYSYKYQDGMQELEIPDPFDPEGTSISFRPLNYEGGGDDVHIQYDRPNQLCYIYIDEELEGYTPIATSAIPEPDNLEAS